MSPWTSWVCFRYLKSKKNSKFLSFITLLSILGVGVGVTAMIVVLSVMDGFESELKKRLMSSDLHILITPKPETPGFDAGFVPEDTLQRLKLGNIAKENPEVVSIWPVVSTEAIFKVGRKVTGVAVKGVTPERLVRLKKQVTESAAPQLMV